MTVRIEKSDGVWTFVIERPDARNAVDPATADALYAAVLAFDADPSARVGVLTGAGGAFCAGYDLKSAAGEVGRLASLDFKPGEHNCGPMGPTRLLLSKPIIAAIEGPAVAGGMELALWCDCRVMAEGSYMGVYCRRWGVPLIDGGTVRLPRIVGRGRALDLILTGRQVMAEECQQIGLAERVVARGEARRAAEEMARAIARFPQTCMRADRISVYRAEGLDVTAALRSEWATSSGVFEAEGRAGAGRFASGKGRGGSFGDI
jgi:enoyl-CoA hydratase